MTHLRIQLFGPLTVWRGEQPISEADWSSPKARQLFKILATPGERTVASDEIIEWLWPGHKPGSARNSLWVTVSQLRRFLEPEASGRGQSTFILSRSPGYRLSGQHCDIDTVTFLSHVREGRGYAQAGDGSAAADAFRAAEALYADDYLTEDPYEDWAIPPREHLRETFFEIEAWLATHLMAQGAFREALSHCHRILSRDATRESVWQSAIECYWRLGERGQAIRAFERCRAALEGELGMPPMPQTVALVEELFQDRGSWAGPAQPLLASTLLEQPHRLPFIGRETEWGALTGRLQRVVKDGRGCTVLLSGEPGIGKTRLLEELGDLATARGAHVVTGRCYQLEQSLAYAPLLRVVPLCLPPPGASLPCASSQAAAVAELLPQLRELWPELPPYHPLPPDEDRMRVLAGLSQLLLECARSRPLVVMLDDLHWADPSTIQLLHYLGHQIGNYALMLVGAYRSTEIDPHHPLHGLRSVLRQQAGLELGLGPFSLDDLLLLLRILAHDQIAEEFAHHLHHDTQGHPFYLVEVLRTFIQEGLITLDSSGRWRTAYDAVTHSYRELLLPASVRDAILGRLERLSPEDQGLLNLASVIGRSFRPAVAAHLIGWPESRAITRIEQLERRGFLRSVPPDGFEFNHDLVRRAVYESLSRPQCQLLHRQVAGGYLQFDSWSHAELANVAGMVATHYAASDRPWLALEHALAAAEQASRLTAYDEAIAWCEQALEIAESHPTSVPAGYRTRLHLRWRDLWYYRGDLERTLDAGRAALAAARQEGDTEAELQALWYLAHDRTQVTVVDLADLHAEALNLARRLDDPAALALSLARSGSDAGLLALPAERKKALVYLEEAETLARQAGQPALLHQVMTEWWAVGPLPRARAALEEALDLVRQIKDQREEVGTLAKLADVQVRQGDFRAAVASARQGQALALKVDSPPYGAWNLRALGQALVALGEVDEGLRQLREAVHIFEAHAWTAMLAGTLLRDGLMLQMTGNLDAAVAALKRVLLLSRETGEIYESAYALAALAATHLACGDESGGRRELGEAARLSGRISLPWHRGGTLVQLAAGWLLLGEVESALEAATEAIRLAEAEDLREVRVHGLWLQGQALRATGRGREAGTALRAGLAQARAIGHASLKKQLRGALAGSRGRSGPQRHSP